jgi:hypothetical protein
VVNQGAGLRALSDAAVAAAAAAATVPAPTTLSASPSAMPAGASVPADWFAVTAAQRWDKYGYNIVSFESSTDSKMFQALTKLVTASENSGGWFINALTKPHGYAHVYLLEERCPADIQKWVRQKAVIATGKSEEEIGRLYCVDQELLRYRPGTKAQPPHIDPPDGWEAGEGIISVLLHLNTSTRTHLPLHDRQYMKKRQRDNKLNLALFSHEEIVLSGTSIWFCGNASHFGPAWHSMNTEWRQLFYCSLSPRPGHHQMIVVPPRTATASSVSSSSNREDSQ